MMRAGFPVPEGFLIDVNAFVSHFGQTTDPLVKPTPPRIQPELMTDVVQALMEHLADQEQLAVRSSSTEEDSASASFAGLHSTYYFVHPTGWIRQFSTVGCRCGPTPRSPTDAPVGRR